MSSLFGIGGGGNVGASGSFYDYSIDQSLRLEDGKLTRLISSAGDGKTFTVSMWIKRAETGVNHELIAAGHGSDGVFGWRIRSDDTMQFVSRYVNTNGANFQIARRSSRVFRDVGTFYHCVLAVDTTVSGASSKLDYFKIYVNGEDITSDFTTVTNTEESVAATFNDTTRWNQANNKSQSVAYNQAFTTNYFSGYIAEVHSVSGTKLTADSFGETKNGVWVPKEYTGSYGTEGFYFNFANSSDIGNDASSGGSTDYTPSGLGTHDVVSDSPSNNFAVMNRLDNLNWLSQGLSNETYTEGNLQASGSSWMTRSTFRLDSGKWYWEVRKPANFLIAGIYETDGASNNSNHAYYYYQGNVNDATSSRTSPTALHTGSNHADGTIIGVEFDADNLTLEFYANGVSYYKINSVDAGKYTASFGTAANCTFQVNFGQDPTFCGQFSGGDVGTQTDENGNGLFKYAPSTGFLAVCSANLPEPTIGPNSATQADDYFNTVLYTGNATARSITGVGFQPDWVWFKNRSATQAPNLFDSVRGAGKILYSDRNDAEGTTSNHLNSFDSDGFTIGTATSLNGNGNSIVAWNWKAGDTAVSNTSGSITSSVLVNQYAGFSIVSYTGNGTDGATVGHGLSETVEAVIVKRRDGAASWQYLDKNLSSGKVLLLNTTSAEASYSGFTGGGIDNLASTTFSLEDGTSNGDNVNASGGTYIALCFHSVPGYSAVGSYKGNGNADGMHVPLDFRPAWVLVRRFSSAGGWHMFDNKRPNAFNVINKRLEADNSDAENSTSGCELDFLFNGFKFRGTFNNINAAGSDYIYLAFAEAPFKYANAR